jgi:DNA repair exonuclease SbcCD nuclease subunit
VNKIILTADWHFGHQGRSDDLEWAFKKLIKYCRDNKIKKIIILGDLSHSREYFTHDVSCLITKLLNELNEINGMDVIAFPGNHDMFNRYDWKINSLKTFSKSLNLIDYVGKFVYCGRTFWIIPFIEVEHLYMKVINEINNLATENDVLLTHIGVSNAINNTCFLLPNWSVVDLRDTKFSKIFAGHFHLSQSVGDKVFYTGSPISFRFDEGMIGHGFIVYDPKTNEHEFVDLYKNDDSPPDFVTISEDKEIGEKVKGNYVRVILKENDNEDEIKNKLKANGALKIIFAKPKSIKKSYDKIEITKGTSIFESWLKHDNPQKLNHKLLLALESDIRSKIKIEEDEIE